MIFAVFDPSPLTVCINCSFLHVYGISTSCYHHCYLFQYASSSSVTQFYGFFYPYRTSFDSLYIMHVILISFYESLNTFHCVTLFEQHILQTTPSMMLYLLYMFSGSSLIF